MAEENEKQVITIPDLPTTIQGDGRYFVSLLRKYLKSVNTQVNLANGFTQDDIEEEEKGDYTRPKNLTLTFDRLGGVLNWDAIADSDLAYYEIRTDTNVGNIFTGLLERTTATSSTILPESYAGKIYLYAVSKDGKVSNAATLTYSKRRPDAPGDISLTKNNEGTLITFLEIPSDCIGANVYIDGVKYQTLDNVFLYPGFSVKTVAVAYYDQFGEGEKAYFSCEVPNVTGFWVEKNGANLYFYWDAVAVYNVTYIVRIGSTNEWNTGVEIFRTKINKHRYIRPNEDQSYFMIKAMDSHNNFSDDWAWYQIDASAEINKNLILRFDQESVGYSGQKINMYVNSTLGGLQLEKEGFNGEYTMAVQLAQKIKARNWTEWGLNAITNESLRVCDCTFPVNSDEAKKLLIIGNIGDLNGVEFRQQIARETDVNTDLFSAITDGTEAATGGTILENQSITQKAGRYGNGIMISDVSKLSYTVSVPEVFSVGFWLKYNVDIPDSIIMELVGENKLILGYDTLLGAFYLQDDSTGTQVSVSSNAKERDWIYIGITQSETQRTLFCYFFLSNKSDYTTIKAAPCGTFSTMYFYHKE